MELSSYYNNIIEEIKLLGSLGKKVRATIDLFNEILQRLSLDLLLRPTDIFAVRTVQETTLLKKFLVEYDELPAAVQENPSFLQEKGKLLVVSGELARAVDVLEKAAGYTKDRKKRGSIKFNQFQALLHKNAPEQALHCYQEAVDLLPDVCQLFDARRYTPEKILEIRIWGVSFLCREGNTRRVIKCIREGKNLGMEAVAQKLGKLRGTNLPYQANVLEVSWMPVSNHPYIVTEFTDAQNLRGYVETNGEMVPAQAVPFLRNLVHGLHLVHGKEIWHGDIKPSNILVLQQKKELIPCIVNLGLNMPGERLKEYESALNKRGSAANDPVVLDLVESIEFAAPEQKNELVEGKIVPPSFYSDVYTFGKTASYLLFKTTRPYAQHWQKFDNGELQKVLETCCLENVKNRYQNFRSLLVHFSTYQFGYEYFLVGEYEKALPYFKKAANEEGSFLAKFVLYLMYRHGDGVDVQEGLAETLRKHSFGASNGQDVKIAAESGDIVAQIMLGYARQYGLLGSKDETEAKQWFNRAADKGYSLAQVHLAVLYRDGIGVTQDHHEAARWYKKAADKGDAIAEYHLGYLYWHGFGVDQNFTEAIGWQRKAAEKGLAAAQTSLGYMYLAGPAVAKNYEEACLWDKSGLQQDYTQARHWLSRAAAKGHPLAQTYLGYIFLCGLGCQMNQTEAHGWLKKAADKGYSLAQYTLSCLYRYGIGVTQDYQEATQWFCKAAEKDMEGMKSVFQEVLSKK
jgi:TPR repeat protein